MRALISLLLLLAIAPVPAEAKTYSAERYDSRIRVLPDGALDVTETVVFRFEDGSFTYVFREISARKTDGIEIVGAEMDGVAMPFGEEPGQVEVRRRGRLHVRWHFTPREGTTHTFTLHYIARGVVQRAGGQDVLEWRALPADHGYRIDSSDVVIEYPEGAALQGEPRVRSRDVAETDVQQDERRVRITTSGIGKDGWLEARLQFDEGSVIASVPAWQARDMRAAASAPQWATAAAVVFGAGLLLIFALRARFNAPPEDPWSNPAGTVPETLRPALAGALASNGSVMLQHAMATLFALADRGDITIVEEPRKWGGRRYTLNRMPAGQGRHPEEQMLLGLAFQEKGRDEEAVPLAKARTRIARGLRGFKAVVHQELRALGLVDDDRIRARSRFVGVAGALLLLAGVMIVPAGVLARDFDGWPFLVVVALAVVAIVGFIVWGTLTPLSNEGYLRAGHWRRYRQHLKDVARDCVGLTTDTPASVLPYAVALNLAAAWSKFMKRHPGGVPPWYRALSTTDADGGFPAFIAYGGAGSDGGGGGGGGGGAAGGGGSGAG